MPSVGSTPTTTSPAPSQQQQQQHLASSSTASLTQHPKLQTQHSLPLQLQYHPHHPQQSPQQQQVTTTQPSPAGTFVTQLSGGAGGLVGGDCADMSPLSSSNSFSSVDTNQTLLNSIVNHQQLQQQQQQQHTPAVNRTASSSAGAASSGNTNGAAANKRAYRTKYSQFMIITPAVSIDRDCDRETNGVKTASAAAQPPVHADLDNEASYFGSNGNNNVFRMSLLQSSCDSGNSSDSSFRSNYNPYLHTSRQHLLSTKGRAAASASGTGPHFYTFSASSWRWCSLICAAMRCFGAGHSSSHHASYSRTGASRARPPYQRSRSSPTTTSAQWTSATPHRRLRSSPSSTAFTAETAFEHFSAPFKPRRTRDHMNNITYEL